MDLAPVARLVSQFISYPLFTLQGRPITPMDVASFGVIDTATHVIVHCLHEAVWWALEEYGIVIAFPQMDAHFDGAFHERLNRLPRAS